MKSDFYQSKAWKQIRQGVWLKQHCICARCGRAVYVDGISDYLPKEKRLRGIVHHKEYLTEQNYTDDDIALNADNLEGLCIDCHNVEHARPGALKKNLMFDKDGNLVERWPGR